MANNKKIIWIGIASALLIGGGTFFWWKNKKAKDEEEKRRIEEEARKEEEAKKAQQSANAPRTVQYPATPFANALEGNNFRVWVNKKYPDYAKQNDLSLMGAYDNSFMRKAFAKYGAEYLTATTPVKAKGWSKNDKVYLTSGVNEVGVYSIPDKNYAIGNITKYLTLDKPIGYFIEDTGKNFFKVKIVSYLPLGKIHSKSASDLIIGAKDVYLPKFALSKSPY
jgi:hypothetical protein